MTVIERRRQITLKWRPAGAPARRVDDFAEVPRLAVAATPPAPHEPERREIGARLENWARWATETERRIEVSPTGKMIDRAKIAAGIIEDKTNERRNVDEADAQLIERNMCNLLPKYRVILKWHYIKGAHRGVVCRKMGIDHRPASIFDDLLRKAHDTIEALVNTDKGMTNEQRN